MAQYFKDMLEERENSERMRERRRSGRIPRAAMRYASIPVVDRASPWREVVGPLEPNGNIYDRTWLVSGVVGQGEEPIDDPITIRAPHTSIVIDAPADRQCQLCGWYFAVGRSPETIRHFINCPLFNPHGVDE